jgi:hypothetical protein
MGPLIQEVHYYLEDGKIVYTELYHALRTYCCSKDCRHCPYDPRNTVGTMDLKFKESED